MRINHRGAIDRRWSVPIEVGPPPDLRIRNKIAASPTRDAEKILNVYSWLDYIAPDTVANFEKETGIKVRYDTYDNNEVLETKSLTGHTGYDVVLPTGAFFERQRQAGVYRKLDKAELPNLINADPEIMRRLAVYDPGNFFRLTRPGMP
jgi:putrescine transport system substrate-binding protein